MSVSTEWYGMPFGLKYPLAGFMIVSYRLRNHWSYLDCEPAGSASVTVVEPDAYPEAEAVNVPWPPPSAAAVPAATVTFCGTLQFEVVKVRLAPEETDRSGSPPLLSATDTVTLDDGWDDSATPKVWVPPCWTATEFGLTTTVGDSTVIAIG